MKDADKGLGLNNIINRVKSIHGTSEFITGKGKGTEVRMAFDMQYFE